MPNSVLPLPTVEDDLMSSLDFLPGPIAAPSLDMDVGKLKDEMLAGVPDVTADLKIPDMKGAPSAADFKRALQGPLSQATAVNGDSLLAGIKGSLPVKMDPSSASQFDVNGIASDITGKILPNGAVPAPIKVDIALPAGMGGDFSGPLQRLAEAGAGTPIRLLRALLKILDEFIATATDAEQLKEFTAQALQEILIAQTQVLRDRLPVTAVQRAREPLDAAYLDRYATLLDGLERVQATSGAEMLAAVKAVRDELLPPLKRFEAASATLVRLRADQADALRVALGNVVDFATADEVFLKGLFDQIQARVGVVLDGIGGPVNQLADMIEELTKYLEQAADMATQAAEEVSKKIQETLRTVGSQLELAQQKITEIAEQINAFIEKVDISDAINAFKNGCNQVVDGVDRFFTEVERARKQLDDAVKQLKEQVGDKVRGGLDEMEAQIRELLDKIVGLLDREEVKNVLDQAKAGIDKLKTAIDQASLEAVFDVVVDKTGQLEAKIQAIDTARLGTPQKTALKVGVKVIEQVKVDEIIRPELEDAFAQILEPLKELIQLLKQKVLVIEQEIDAFNPGTLVTDLIAPYLDQAFAALDSFRPSQLLEPIKEAIEQLAKIVEQLDPQRVLDEIQRLYDRLSEIVDSLEPGPLTRTIAEAANTANAQLVQVRDVYLEQLLATIKESVSLQRLLEGTGIQEIADAEIWDLLRRTLGGDMLDLVTEAVDSVKEQLDAEFASLDYSAAAREVKASSDAVKAQIAASPADFFAGLTDFGELLGQQRSRVEQLEQRRKALLDARPGRPEVVAVLREMELEPLLELAATVDGLVTAGADVVTPGLATVKSALEERSKALAGIKEAAIRKTVPAIFEAQLAAPLRELIAAIKEKLKPFKKAVDAIQEFLRTTLTELPKRIDKAVGDLLDTVKSSLQGVLSEVIATIGTLRDAIIETINKVYRQVKKNVDKLNPTLVLNSFLTSDFVGTANGGPPAGIELIATRIAEAGDGIAPLLQAKLTTSELDLLKAKTSRYEESVLKALNDLLIDDALAKSQVPAARKKLDEDKAKYEATLKTAEGDAWVTARKSLLRNLALGRQLDAANKMYLVTAPAAGRIRLNRVILEAHYPDALKMSLQGLHPFVVEQIGNLYPVETVQRIDDFYVEMLTELRRLPDRMIRAPLDEAFEKVKAKLKETFDIQGLFRVLEVKLDGMDGDLSEGLDRLSIVYNRLLTTLDQRLAG